MPKEKHDEIRRRVWKLLILGAGNTPEAESARALADRLMKRHGLTKETLGDDESQSGEEVIKSKRFMTSWRMILFKIVTMPLGVALLRRTDTQNGGPRVILRGRLDLVRDAKHAYRHFEKLTVELAMKQPEAIANTAWRKDFCRGVAECLQFRWKEHVRQGPRPAGGPPPTMAPAPASDGPGEPIRIEPVMERLARHEGMRAGNLIPMPERRKRAKKKKLLEPRLLPPMQTE